MGRLDEFEAKNINSDIAEHIPDQDLLFLKKEVARFKQALISLKSQKDTTLDDSLKEDKAMKDPNFIIGPEQL